MALVLAAALCLPPPAAAAPRAPEGLWFTPGHDGVVRIASCKPGGATLCGVILGVTPDKTGMPRDVTGAPQCRLTLLDHLALQDDGRWHGTVRDPEDGRVYSAEVWLGPDGNMRLRGYIGLELFGSTQTWQPFTGTLKPDCRFTG